MRNSGLKEIVISRIGMNATWHQLLGIALGGVYVFSGHCTYAQIIPDRTLSKNSSVTISGSIFNINGGTQTGRNLFHSFQQFSVPTGGTASFNNGLDVENIFSRVTGGAASSVDGLIKANGTANVFILNPNGIVFGKNASLNIGGSFVTSTANSIKFADGFEFNANSTQTPPLLTISVPTGLQFGGTVKPITVQGASLTVQPGKTLAVIGGDESFDGGSLQASNGRVELGAIAGAGKVDLNWVDNQLHLSVPDSLPRADISMNNGALVDVTGNGRGSVAVTAHNLEIKDGSKISAGVKLGSVGDTSAPGDITLNATGLITIMNPSTVTNMVMVTIEGQEDTKKGDAGDINIIAGDIYIDNRNTSADYTPGDYIPDALQASSGGVGRAGNISLSATGSINLIGQDSNVKAGMISTFFLNSQMPGGGDITLKANGSIYLNNAYLISSQGNGSGNISIFGKESVSITDNSFLNAGTVKGDSGKITIQSNGPVSIERSSLGTNAGKGSAGDGIPGNGGDINISGRSILITRGSLLESSAEQEGFKSGNISLSATDRIEISGYDPLYNPECCTGNHNRPFLYTTLRTSSLPGSLGPAGDINVNTPTLRVSDGAILRADSQNALNGGNINVNANVVELSDGGQLVTNALGTGDAGNINLKSIKRLVIDGTNPTFDKFSAITQTFVPINDSSAKYQLGSTTGLSGIFASTTLSQGGNITVEGAKLVLLRHGAQISATANNNGNGGNIMINAPNGFIVAIPSENSDILASANEGSGGRIRIKAAGIYGLENRTKLPPDPTISEINASSEFGKEGIVQINTPEVDPSRGLVALPTPEIDSSKLVTSQCGVFNEAEGNSFTVTGRGGLPPSPDEPLTTDVVWADTRLPITTTQQQHQHETHAAEPFSKTKPVAIVPATGWIFNNKGEVILISAATSNTSASTPTSCPVKTISTNEQPEAK
jgi:filamentous hemagglutinin family protein